MKTKTLILAIFGLLALANAEEEFSIDQSEARKANPEPNEPKAYAHPGYEQHAYKYVQFKLNYSGISCSILFA